MRPLVDEKLHDMQDKRIITPVTEPTDWVSSLAYLIWDHCRTQTVEEITYELAGSTKFIKVDESSSYHCLVLIYESSILTTFNTHREDFALYGCHLG